MTTQEFNEKLRLSSQVTACKAALLIIKEIVQGEQVINKGIIDIIVKQCDSALNDEMVNRVEAQVDAYMEQYRRERESRVNG